MLSRLTLLVALALAASGCNVRFTAGGEQIICTSEYVPAIKVEVFDAETGYPAACGAVVTLRDGNFEERISNREGPDCDERFVFSGAGERPGVYDIQVVKDGYLAWYKYDVVVSENLCHVNTITVQAYLEK